jgi:hypothetical protein
MPTRNYFRAVRSAGGQNEQNDMSCMNTKHVSFKAPGRHIDHV